MENRTVRTGQCFGNYQILQQLGRGGFAEVYLGEHRYLATRAALKVVTAPLDALGTAAFLREARTLAHLLHPHIVRVLEFGIEDTTPFLVLDYAPGGTLRQRHPRGERLPLMTVVNYVTPLASALQYAHDKGLVHRDVKPENILLGSDGTLMLADFGIAVLIQQTRSVQTLEVVGTPSYMAPEQLQGHPCPASDQYALGILAYEWLCGFPPFSGSFAEVAAQHCLTPPPPLTTRVPSLSPQVERIIFQALAKDPASRFPDVVAFAEALSAAVAASVPPGAKEMPSASGRRFSSVLARSGQPAALGGPSTQAGTRSAPISQSKNGRQTWGRFAPTVPFDEQADTPVSRYSFQGNASSNTPTTAHPILWTLVSGIAGGYLSSGILLLMYSLASPDTTAKLMPQGYSATTSPAVPLIMACFIGGVALLSLSCAFFIARIASERTGKILAGSVTGSLIGLTQQAAAGILGHAIPDLVLPASFPWLVLLWTVLGGLLGLLGAGMLRMKQRRGLQV
ncbi:MAG: serine/threonine-protein kinase [Ktedonobacteraceae bacterium]